MIVKMIQELRNRMEKQQEKLKELSKKEFKIIKNHPA